MTAPTSSKPLPASPATTPRLGRLLLTGAAGVLGRELRRRLRPDCQLLRLSDRAPLADLQPGEEGVQAPLEDRAAVLPLLAGIDAVLHFGGISVEAAFDPILQANIAGTFNIYEAARLQGVRRVVFASSNHVTGFYAQTERVDPRSPLRPDTLYGVSKAFGENLAQLYFDRYGIETVSLRIASCLPEPVDRRTLASWLSYDDLERLVRAALLAPKVGHCVVYGVSANPGSWWGNPGAARIRFEPQDSAEPWRAAIEARFPHPDPNDVLIRYQGGSFIELGPY
jgi:uronate dehydrogenase